MKKQKKEKLLIPIFQTTQSAIAQIEHTSTYLFKSLPG